MSAISNKNNYAQKVERVLFIILLLNIVVVIIKGVTSWLTSSLTVLTDTIHSSMDAANNIVGILIVRYASAPPDKEHPYGHDKFETLGAFSIAAFLAVTCFEISSRALQQIILGQTPITNIGKSTFLMMLLTIVINIFVAKYEANQGKQLNSHLLIADAGHTMSDVYVTLSVILSLFFSWFGYGQIDAFFALAIAGFIAYQSYQIFRQTIPVLVDAASLDSSEIEKLALTVPGVKYCNNIRSRGKPGALFVEMVITVMPESLEKAHQLTEQIERKLKDQFGRVAITIHFEPSK